MAGKPKTEATRQSFLIEIHSAIEAKRRFGGVTVRPAEAPKPTARTAGKLLLSGKSYSGLGVDRTM